MSKVQRNWTSMSNWRTNYTVRCLIEGAVGMSVQQAVLAVWQIVVIAGRQRDQRLQVVAQHLGGDILHDGLLRQARDVLQIDSSERSS